MILYFTGTGNSKYVADMIADITNDVTVSLNEVIKFDKPKSFSSETPFVFVAPIYAWRFPLIIEQLIKDCELNGSNKVYFVATMGSKTGDCDKYLKKIADGKQIEYMGFCGVSMPSNYVITDVMSSKDEAVKIIKGSESLINNIAVKIKNDESIEKVDKTKFAFLMSGVVNKMFSKYMVSSNDYIVSDNCISCGKCKSLCAVNNIEMKDGKPVFGTKCINCYACIQNCPQAAIDIKGKTETHGRYVCHEYNKG